MKVFTWEETCQQHRTFGRPPAKTPHLKRPGIDWTLGLIPQDPHTHTHSTPSGCQLGRPSASPTPRPLLIRRCWHFRRPDLQLPHGGWGARPQRRARPVQACSGGTQSHRCRRPLRLFVLGPGQRGLCRRAAPPSPAPAPPLGRRQSSEGGAPRRQARKGPQPAAARPLPGQLPPLRLTHAPGTARARPRTPGGTAGEEPPAATAVPAPPEGHQGAAVPPAEPTCAGVARAPLSTLARSGKGRARPRAEMPPRRNSRAGAPVCPPCFPAARPGALSLPARQGLQAQRGWGAPETGQPGGAVLDERVAAVAGGPGAGASASLLGRRGARGLSGAGTRPPGRSGGGSL